MLENRVGAGDTVWLCNADLGASSALVSGGSADASAAASSSAPAPATSSSASAPAASSKASAAPKKRAAKPDWDMMMSSS